MRYFINIDNIKTIYDILEYAISVSISLIEERFMVGRAQQKQC